MINIIITFYPEAIGPFSTNYLLARPNKQWKWPFLVVPITKQATPLLIQQLSNPLLFTKRTVDLKRRKSISPTVRTHCFGLTNKQSRTNSGKVIRVQCEWGGSSLAIKICIYPMTTLRHGEARPPFNMPMPVGWYIVRAVQEASHC